jgi:1,4-dihydroxy-2-naphthoate octaprenyltransferase
VLNDYFDYTSGIDLEAKRTPFNGGSGILNDGFLTPRQTLCFGLSAFVLAIPIGLYFVVIIGWPILPLFLLGSGLVFLGTSHISKLGYGLGELAAGFGLGALPVFGTAWVVHGIVDPRFIYASLISAIWVFNLLLLNEFPDEQPDKNGGRKTLVVQLGIARAHDIYTALNILAWVWIAACVAFAAIPKQCLLAFFALPLGLRAIVLSREPDYAEGGYFQQAQAANVGLTLAGHFLLAAGYYWAAV